VTISKGFIHTRYDIYCTCGYSEQLRCVLSGDTSTVAKNQGWTWDVEKGWMCPACSKFSNLAMNYVKEDADATV
jgi:hypothetical protein